MKRSGIAALLAAVCVTLTACGAGGEQVTTTAPAEIIEAAKTKTKVSVAREESFEYTDAGGNRYNAVYRIPSINLDSEDARAANAAILEKYSGDFTKAEEECAHRSGLTCDSLDYEKFENDRVLSVVIRRVYFSHAVDYTVYHFDTKTKESLTRAELAKAAGMTEEEALARLEKELEKDYVSKYKVSKPENYAENLEKTLSEENLDDAQFYLGKDGALTAICKEYATVGNGEFSVVLDLS